MLRRVLTVGLVVGLGAGTLACGNSPKDYCRKRSAAWDRAWGDTVEKKQRRRNPAAPFTTSTLQQEAARKLGFGAQRTMRIAQQLYEGIETDDGLVGLITYMRTDSVTLAAEAIAVKRNVSRPFGGSPAPGLSAVRRRRRAAGSPAGTNGPAGSG